MKTKTREFKKVEYFYPTSPYADYTGFKNGGYVVETYDSGKSSVYEMSFADEKSAVDYANSIPQKWCPLYVRLGRKTN